MGEGLIKTHFARADGAPPMFHEDEVIRFVRRLQAATDHVECHDGDQVPLAEAAGRCHCTTNWLIERAFAGELRFSSVLEEPYRLPEFRVSLAGVRRILANRSDDQVSAAEAARAIGIPVGAVHRLADAGLLPARSEDFRLANRACRMFDDADIEVFTAKFIRLRGLAGERKVAFAQMRKHVEEAGVKPIEVAGLAAEFFLRSEIEKIAHQPGGRRLARLLMVDEARREMLPRRGSAAGKERPCSEK